MKKIQESLTTAINVYLVLLLAVLPLYMREGFVMLGDAKYLFFRNVTWFFCLVCAGMVLAGWIGDRRLTDRRLVWSVTDIAALCFGIASVISWCFAADRSVGMWGFSGWYMGLVSQLLFLWVYYAVSRWYDGAEYVLHAFFAGAVSVIGLGVLNKYNLDPLRLYGDLDEWNKGHLLSTIGNQNWYCGYVSVAGAVCIAYACIGKGARKIAGCVSCLLLGLTILTQGSEGGYLILLAEMAVLFFWALENRRRMLSFCSVALAIFLAAPLGEYGIRFRGLVLVEDGSLKGMLYWGGWKWLSLVCVSVLVVLAVREKKGCADMLQGGKIKKWFLGIAGSLLLFGIIVLVGCQVSDRLWSFWGRRELLRINDDWGNGRGALWRMGVGSFFQGSAVSLVFGAGPDCFSYAVYGHYPVYEILAVKGQWQEAVFANAHNEWLNMLVNEGITGFVFYAGIFITLFARLWKGRKENEYALLGMLAIAGYSAYGLVSFQQVTSTPLIFAVMGIAEAKLRAAGEANSK